MADDLLLASDSLASFLRELDDLDDHTTHASAASHNLDSPVSLSGAVLPPPETKQRVFTPAEAHTSATARSKPRHGDRVKKLRTEIRSLYQQLQRLQHISSRGAADSSWKRRAACERLARDQAEYDNAQLKQRLLEGSKLCHEVKRLLLKQRVQLPRSRAEATYSLVDDTHMFGRLQADLSRRQHQLELSMQHRVREITQQNLLGEFRQDKWNIVARGRSLHVDVVESVLLPFNASMVNAIISQYTQSGSVQAAGDNAGDRVIWGAMTNDVEPRDRCSGGRHLKSRSILRRIQTEFGLVLLWESVSYWQSTDTSPFAVVRESGWSIIAPAGEDQGGLSVGYCGRSLCIQPPPDGSRLDQSDPLVQKIVHLFQESHAAHTTRMGNIVMDRSLQVIAATA